MEDLERTIVNILKKINESSMEELNNIKIEESNTGRIHMKIENGNKIYVIPKAYFYMITKAVEDEKERKLLNEKRENKIFEDENKDMFEFLDKNSRIKTASTSNLKEKSKTHSSINKKRDIKNNPKKIKRQKYIAMAKKGLKALAIAALITGTAVIGIKLTADAVKDFYDYKTVEASVEGIPEDKIKDEAESILKEEISKATNVEEEKIFFSDELNNLSTSSSTYTVTVNAGEEEYEHVDEKRDLLNFNNNTLSGKVADLIYQIKHAEGRKGAIKALKNSKKFSENYNLKVDNHKLIEEEEQER